jgi:hypothetical protein
LIAELIASGRSFIDLDDFSPARFNP